MPREPQSDESLVDFPELARSGDDAAAIDHPAYSVGRHIFLDQKLRSELGGPVEGTMRAERKGLSDAFRGNSRRRLRSEFKSRPAFLVQKAIQLFDRIYPARRKEYDIGSIHPGEFKAVRGA